MRHYSWLLARHKLHILPLRRQALYPATKSAYGKFRNGLCCHKERETKLCNTKQHDARLEACLGFDDGVQVLAKVEASGQVHIQPVHVEPHTGTLIQVWTSGMSRFACCRWDCGTTQTDSKCMTAFAVGLSWHRVRYGRRERFDGFDQRLRLHSAHLLHSVSSLVGNYGACV